MPGHKKLFSALRAFKVCKSPCTDRSDKLNEEQKHQTSHKQSTSQIKVSGGSFLGFCKRAERAYLTKGLKVYQSNLYPG